MPQQTRVHNPGPFEVVIDLDGHQLAGQTSGTVVADARTEALIEAGQLLRLPEPPAPRTETVTADPPAEEEPAKDTPKATKSKKPQAPASEEATAQTGAK